MFIRSTLLFGVLLAQLGSQQVTAEQARKPNILLIVGDDMNEFKGDGSRLLTMDEFKGDGSRILTMCGGVIS